MMTRHIHKLIYLWRDIKFSNETHQNVEIFCRAKRSDKKRRSSQASYVRIAEEGAASSQSQGATTVVKRMIACNCNKLPLHDRQLQIRSKTRPLQPNTGRLYSHRRVPYPISTIYTWKAMRIFLDIGYGI